MMSREPISSSLSAYHPSTWARAVRTGSVALDQTSSWLRAAIGSRPAEGGSFLSTSRAVARSAHATRATRASDRSWPWSQRWAEVSGSSVRSARRAPSATSCSRWIGVRFWSSILMTGDSPPCGAATGLPGPSVAKDTAASMI